MPCLAALMLLLMPGTAHAATMDSLTPADGALVVGGLLIAGLIGRRRRGLPDSCD